MENTPEDVKRLEDEFKKCQKILSAIGDKTRQHLICTMLNGKARKSFTRCCFSSHADTEICRYSKRPKRRYLHILLSESRYQRIEQSDNLVLRYKGTYEKRSGKE